MTPAQNPVPNGPSLHEYLTEPLAQNTASVIHRLDHNWLTRTLRITFNRGEVYAYRGVPWRVARELEKASDGAGSVGQAAPGGPRARHSRLG